MEDNDLSIETEDVDSVASFIFSKNVYINDNLNYYLHLAINKLSYFGFGPAGNRAVDKFESICADDDFGLVKRYNEVDYFYNHLKEKVSSDMVNKETDVEALSDKFIP